MGKRRPLQTERVAMTREEITEGNVLIAEFMGWKKTNGFEGDTRLTVPRVVFNDPKYRFIEPERIMYHTSWDCLIPVVEKAVSICGQLDFNSVERLVAEDIFYSDNMLSEIIEGDIEAIYNRSIKFIKFYNQIK